MSTTYPTTNPITSHISRPTTSTTRSCIRFGESTNNYSAPTATSSLFDCGGYGGEPQTTEKPISDPNPSPSATNTHFDESTPSNSSSSGADTVVNLAAIISSIGLVVFGIGCLRLRQMRQQQRRIRESSDHLRDHLHLPHPSSPSSSPSPHDHFLPPQLLPPVPPTPSSSLALSMSMQQPSFSLPPLPPLVPPHLLLYSQPRSTPQQHIEMLARLQAQDQYPDPPPPPYEAPPPRLLPRYR
ncbi:hypothetical protein MVEG_09586 [Podila verticillata NRRL 6337]|nr:hypothetical protein MVEG_09586 [Podila verticillata NRRL 6337]